jgi:aspartyl/asparaginyl beta-hydroxylase (cupin superfamily)
MTHAAPVQRTAAMQNALIFHMPDLPAHPVEPNSRFDWVPTLEKATGIIRAEYEAFVGAGATAEPYVPAGTTTPEWSRLSGALDWSAIHLFQNARELKALECFPRTARVLDAVDLVRIDGRPMEVFFSQLKAGAHIPPHYGLTNTRVTVHLPLVVPDNCMIRVAQHVHHWREGVIFAFDDSFEHEAWNRSNDDRTVLIFEAHHPDLSAPERAAIEHAYDVRQRWLDSRRDQIDAWLRRAGASTAGVQS